MLAVFTELGSAQCLVIGLNVGAFVMCGYDKSIAGGKATRVPEAVLLGAGLLGGSAGLLLGMKVFRHKTAKASFQFVLAIVIIVQLAVLKYFGVLDELALWMRSS